MKNFKRIFVWLFAVVCVAGMGFGLVGCGDKTPSSVQVHAFNLVEGNWVEVATKKVDTQHGFMLDDYEPQTGIPDGMEFYGWSTRQDWQEGSGQFVVEGNYITYNAVKGVAKNGKINLYPAYRTKINYYFVFGVYTYETRSGITAENVQQIKTALLNYLQTVQSATAEQLALVDVREYSESAVADYGAKIMKKGDVDVFVGCGNNINTDGGVTIVTKSGAFTINGITGRRFILLNYDDLSVAVYNWFQGYIHDNFDNTYTPVDFIKTECNVTYALGEHAATGAQAPEGVQVYNNQKITLPAAPTAEEGYMFAGWRVGSELKEAGAQVTITESITITAEFEQAGFIVSYSNGLATRTAATTTPEDVRGLEDGAVVILPDAPAAKEGFTFAGWRVGAELKAAGAEVEVHENLEATAEYAVDTTANLTITIGYYAKTATSGLDATIMGNVKSAFETYLASVGITTGYNNIAVKGYGEDKNVANTGIEINEDLTNEVNVGVMLGFAGNLQSGGGVEYKTRESGFTMGGVSGRYVYRLTDSAISNIVYDWMVAEGSTFRTAVAGA